MMWRLYALSGTVLAVLLILFGFYRAGHRAAIAGQTKKTLSRVHQHRVMREEIENEIREERVASGNDDAAFDKLLNKWSRE